MFVRIPFALSQNSIRLPCGLIASYIFIGRASKTLAPLATNYANLLSRRREEKNKTNNTIGGAVCSGNERNVR